MFNNIGKKIKTMAQVIAYVGSTILVISGLGNIMRGLDQIYLDSSIIVFGVIFVIFGPVFSYASSLLIYGFGQLIENTDKLSQKDNEENNT